MDYKFDFSKWEVAICDKCGINPTGFCSSEPEKYEEHRLFMINWQEVYYSKSEPVYRCYSCLTDEEKEQTLIEYVINQDINRIVELEKFIEANNAVLKFTYE